MLKEITYQDALAYFGSVRKMAYRLGITQQAIYLWGGKIPKLRQYQIRDLIATDGTPNAA